jgi:hypothetical protein
LLYKILINKISVEETPSCFFKKIVHELQNSRLKKAFRERENDQTGT